MAKRVGIFLLTAVIGSFCLDAIVEAVIGRPLTPVSVAGVARRTARRCAVGIYC